MTAPDERYASFHWPTSLNPMVSADDLDAIQDREPSHYFNREYLAVRFPPNRRGIDNEEHDAREAEEVRPGVS